MKVKIMNLILVNFGQVLKQNLTALKQMKK